MLKGLPTDQFGIKLTEVGPWEIEEGNWQLCYVPVPTKQCDLCADRTARGKLPSCVKHCQARCMEFGAVEELAQKLAAKPRQVLFSVE
jgi:anaerobic dimethyl sulfoxide reductase subunit B (iron-sulfur subunit)